jgi:hypothetical protein
MTDYTITTNFGAKDSLPSGNAGKVIKGSEFTTEFTNIQTAIATKADTAGDTFTGAVTFDAAVTLNADVIFDTDTMFVDVSANRVGIGTNSPDSKLHIRENQTADTAIEVSNEGTSGATTTSSFIVSEAEGSPTGWFRRYRDGTNRTALGFSGDFVFEGDISNTPEERMRIDASGNVGIGTTSPDSILDVVGADPILTIRDTSTSGADSHATLRLAESDGSGNVNVRFDVALDEGDLTFDYSNGDTTS